MQNATATLQPAFQNQPAVLLLEGNLTLSNAEPIRRQLLELLGQPGGLLIRIERVTALDAAFVQLLCALRHSVRELGKPTELVMDLPEEHRLLVARAGLHECMHTI